MKKNILYVSLIIIITGVMLIGLTGCTSKITVETDGENDIHINTNVITNSEDKESNEKNNEESSVENNENNTTKNTEIIDNNKINENNTKIDNTSGLTKEEIAKKAYSKYIEDKSKIQGYELKNYKIESVEILTFEEVKKYSEDIEIYYKNVKTEDIFASVTYSVEPKDGTNNMNWLAGAGDIEGDWIKNKKANIYLVKDGDTYTIESNGTDW